MGFGACVLKHRRVEFSRRKRNKCREQPTVHRSVDQEGGENVQ